MSESDKRKDITVEQYLTTVDEPAQKDARILLNVMHQITNEEPILYSFGTIGFGVYKYEYKSGRKGESHTLGFYPRKGKTTIYLMDGTIRYADLLSKLGKHKTTGYCVYVQQLSDIKLPVLTKILEESYKNINAKSKKGVIDSILWQTEK